MNRSKVIAFFQEFPWLGNFYTPDQIPSIRVSRVSRDLMTTLVNNYWGNLLLLERNGTMLGRGGVKLTPKWWWRNRQVNFSETVGDAIARLGVVNRVHFVVIKDPYSHLTIYKSPKNFTITAWLEEEIRRERAAIRAETEKIDALADQK